MAKNSHNWVEVGSRYSDYQTCPICGRSGWCASHIDGFTVKCHRAINSLHDEVDGFDGELYVCAYVDTTPSQEALIFKKKTFLDATRSSQQERYNQGILRKQQVERERNELLSKILLVEPHAPSVIHNFLETLILRLHLDELHYGYFEERGLSPIRAFELGFRSVPYYQVIDKRIRETEEDTGITALGIPGVAVHLYKNKEQYGLHSASPQSLLIPIRTSEGLLCGLQVRKIKNDGQKIYTYVSISPDNAIKYNYVAATISQVHTVHVAVPKYPPVLTYIEPYSICITEGVVKAEVLANYSNSLTLGLIGFRQYLPAIQAIIELVRTGHRVNHIYFALDQDSDPNVRENVRRIIQTFWANLHRIVPWIQFHSLRWSESVKGIDDAIAHKLTIQSDLFVPDKNVIIPLLPEVESLLGVLEPVEMESKELEIQDLIRSAKLNIQT